MSTEKPADAEKPAAAPVEPETLSCIACGTRTSRREARLRIAHTGRCICGGELQPVEPAHAVVPPEPERNTMDHIYWLAITNRIEEARAEFNACVRHNFKAEPPASPPAAEPLPSPATHSPVAFAKQLRDAAFGWSAPAGPYITSLLHAAADYIQRDDAYGSFQQTAAEVASLRAELAREEQYASGLIVERDAALAELAQARTELGNAVNAQVDRIKERDAALARAERAEMECEGVRQQLGTRWDHWRQGASLARCVEDLRMEHDLHARNAERAERLIKQVEWLHIGPAVSDATCPWCWALTRRKTADSHYPTCEAFGQQTSA